MQAKPRSKRAAPRSSGAMRSGLFTTDGAADVSMVELLDRMQLFGVLTNQMALGVVVMDGSMRVVALNDTFAALTGRPPADVIGDMPVFVSNLRDDARLFRRVNKSLKDKGHWEGEVRTESVSGSDVVLQIAMTALSDDGGAICKFGAMVRDVTAERASDERIRYQANFDALTGLPNRALFMDRLSQSVAAMGRSKDKLGLMFIDLDGFKLVNDTLGHDKGDDLLREAAARISKCVRQGDTLARLGGDEFTIIMPNLKNAKDAPLLAQRILAALAESFALDGVEAFVSGSIGITICPDDALYPQDLLRNADAAMYRAKEMGKANFQFFTNDLNEEMSGRLALRNGLLRALERDEFQLHYQPKLDLLSGRTNSVEALMRWNSAELGTVPPSRFVPVLEETGMAVEFGEWAIECVCRQHRAWIDSGLPPIRVAVNLSTRQLREMSFVSVLTRVLEDTGVAAESLEIEITESMLMLDTENAISALTQLHELGVRVAMDDFGTGYSSLSHLRKFPIDTIKIDGTFIADMTVSDRSAEIVRTIIGMGKALGMQIVAEGVETAEQVEMLRAYGCDEVQGYHVSEPAPGNTLIGFLHAHAY